MMRNASGRYQTRPSERRSRAVLMASATVVFSLLALSSCAAESAPAPPVDRALSQQIGSFRTSLLSLAGETATTQELAARIHRGDLVFATAMPTTIDKSYLPKESDFVGRYGSKVSGDAVQIQTLVFASSRAAASPAYLCIAWTVTPKAKTVATKQVTWRADIQGAESAVKAQEQSLNGIPN